MKSILINSALLVIFLFVCRANGTILNVPADYSTIQAAINAASNGDTVLVAQGRYYENINFLGKNILVTSQFLNNNDVQYISTTIIDGSKPADPDKASCVLIVSGEDSSAILQGFTLTGGKGTKWVDEHGAGTYVEGGGILTTLSSPTIKYNIIIDNEAISSPNGTLSAGGGALRCGDGSPRILNNVIINNRGMYGGGIVLNYCSNARITNNIICANKVYEAVKGKQTFGGGGIWVLASLTGNDLPNIIENNTIIGNSSNSLAGGIRIWSAAAVIRNNIVWNNFQKNSTQINISDSTPLVEYNDVEDGIEGTGNIALSPSFTDSSFLLNNDSPCIDSGNPSVQFNDHEDPNSPGFALVPSKGTIRNDIGVYGGPMSYLLSGFSSGRLSIPNDEYDFGLTLPGESIQISIPVTNIGASVLQVDSAVIQTDKSEISAQNSFPIVLHPTKENDLILTWIPQSEETLVDTLLIFHNEPDLVNPYKVLLTGSSFPKALISFDANLFNYGDIDVNTLRVDTTLYVHNTGTAPDSVYASIIYQVVKPDSAIEIMPKAFKVGSKDSVGITFTIYPPRIKRTAFNLYQPSLVLDSRFTSGTTHFLKTMKFHLIGTTGVDNRSESPTSFDLLQNYPNPFNPSTTINYSVANSGLVSVKIFNILGEEITKLVNGYKNAGSYSVNFEASNLSSGIYFYTMTSGNFVSTKKMVVLR